MSPTREAAVVDELIEMRGLRFHFRDWPSKRVGVPNLVLLHGYTSHARSWDAFAEAMTDRYRVLALDQRGHDETSWAAADQYGVDDMADDLEVFARALDLRSFTLLGLSMGGMVVMEYAGRRPFPTHSARLISPLKRPGAVRRHAKRRHLPARKNTIPITPAAQIPPRLRSIRLQ